MAAGAVGDAVRAQPHTHPTPSGSGGAGDTVEELVVLGAVAAADVAPVALQHGGDGPRTLVVGVYPQLPRSYVTGDWLLCL